MLFSGFFDLPWWGLVLVALALTHVTIVSVTLFLHRCQAHRALRLHPALSHFFRFWLWLTTGTVTREWAAVHRKHHAKVETVEDPHSPQLHGISRVLWDGTSLYRREARKSETLERYGHGTPRDWIERNLYERFSLVGLTLMGLIDLALFGIVPGAAVFLVQMAWIPFWAAGVINGIGHWFGYRSWQTADASRNIVPLGILIGGEELHNNHHAYVTSAKLSCKWYEFDIGWMYIRVLQAFGLAEVKKVAPALRLAEARPVVDSATLEAVITHRHDVLARYGKLLKRIYAEEVRQLRQRAPHDVAGLRALKRSLHREETLLEAQERERLAAVLSRHRTLETVYAMRQELTALWARSTASCDQLVSGLRDWCHRAEATGISQLEEFSLSLRRYA